MSTEAVASTRTLTRSTIIVVLAFAASQALSFAQTFLIADVFGVGAEWDAFTIANRVPEQIFTLIAGGALATALIPLFSGLLAREQRDAAWKLASHVLNTILLIAIVASVLAFIFAPWLVQNVVAPGFSPEQAADTAGLMRVLLITTIIFSVSGTAMGILQSHNRFLAPALAPVLFDVGKLIGAAFLVRQFGVYGIAYGTLIGAALHLLIQLPALVRVGARWTGGLGWNEPDVRRVFRLMVPRVIDLGVFNFNMLMAGNFASRMGEGAVSAFGFGWALMQIPQTLIGTAMGMVIFPTLAALSELNDVDGKRSAMSGALRFILIGTIPAAIGLLLVGRTGISILESGAFDATATQLVYIALQGFALGIIFHSVIEVAARSFFADKDTITPLLIAIGGAAVNLGVSLAFTGLLTQQRDAAGAWVPLPASQVGVLTWANTAGVIFESAVLLFILRRRWKGIEERSLGQTTMKTLAASLVMAVALVLFDVVWAAAGLSGQGRLLTIVQIGVQVLVGAVVFLAAAWMLNLEELKSLMSSLLKRRKLAEVTA